MKKKRGEWKPRMPRGRNLGTRVFKDKRKKRNKHDDWRRDNED